MPKRGEGWLPDYSFSREPEWKLRGGFTRTVIRTNPSLLGLPKGIWADIGPMRLYVAKPGWWKTSLVERALMEFIERRIPS